MKLWPFSKKNEALASAKPVNPHSRKMELPQGVTLAAPSESPVEQNPLPTAGTLPETHRDTISMPPAQPALPEQEQPSLEALSHIPEVTPEQSTPVKPPSKPDLTSFFEQNNLALVSPSAPAPEPQSITSPPVAQPSEQETIAPITNEATLPEPDFTGLPAAPMTTATQQGPAPDWLSPPDTHAPSPQDPSGSYGLTSDFTAPHTTPETTEPPAFLNDFNFFPPELQTTVDAGFSTDADFFTIAQPTTNHESVLDLQADFEPAQVYQPASDAIPTASELTPNFGPPAFDESLPTTTAMPEPTSSQTAHHQDESFFLYTTGNELNAFDDTSLFGFEPKTDTLSDTFNYPATEEAMYQPSYTLETPPSLNLPDEALSPNGNDPFFEAAGLQTQFDPTDYSDDTFDLDSLLLAQASPDSDVEALSSPSLHSPEPFHTNGTDVDLNPPESNLTESSQAFQPEIQSETFAFDDHYFGDEADGLKDADNPDSYDLGHYEDLDEPVIAFEIEDTPDDQSPLDSFRASFKETSLQNSEIEAYSEGLPTEMPEHDLLNADSYQETVPKQPAEAGESYLNMVSLPGPEAFLAPLNQPEIMAKALEEADDTQPANQAAEDEEAHAEPAVEPDLQKESQTPEALPEAPIIAAQPAPAKPRPALRPSLPKSKPYQTSLTDYIDSFEQEVLLKNSQFLRHSINDLVDSYFSQQDQHAS